MKKLFLTICFISAVLIRTTQAGVTEVNNTEELRLRQQDTPPLQLTDERIPDGSDQNAVTDFIRSRLKSKNVIVDSFDEEDPNHLSSMNVQHSAEYINNMETEKRSTFERIYDEALARITAQESAANADTIQNRQNLARQNNLQKQQWQQQSPGFPVVNVFLPPKNTKTLVPAQEHIPFMFSDIEILPTGQISIEETIVVLANNQKLKYGLTRSLPHYSVSRDGTRHPIDINLESVTINDTPIPYKLQSRANRTFIVPAAVYHLSPGVYTYKFKYVVNRHIWEYNDFNEFYWDVTGSNWNLVVARVGALVTLPGQSKPLGQIALTGTRGSLKTQAAVIAADNNAFGFVSTTPLFIGEGLHILISMPKADFIPVDLGQEFSWFLNDYGDIIVSLIGLAAILSGYYISWRQLQNNNRRRHTLRRTAQMLRWMAKNIFDKISFVSFLLELFKKRIIDFARNGDTLSLIKKTDNTTALSRREKKALNTLFGQNSRFDVIPANKLLLERAYKLIRKDTRSNFRLFTLKVNIGYILFSTGMLILSEAFIALLSYNFIHDFSLMLAMSAGIACCIGLSSRKIDNRCLRWTTRLLCTLIGLFCIMLLSVYIRLTAACLIAAMIYTIFAYTKIFTRRNGLIKNNIKEAVEYHDYLHHNTERISLGKDFLSQQANIFAVEASQYYPVNPNIKEFYRLDIAEELLKKI